MKLYGLNYYGIDYEDDTRALIHDGVEYYGTRKERDERIKRIAVDSAEPFDLNLTVKNTFKLNYHGIGGRKRIISKLKSENDELKKKLKTIKDQIKNF